MSRLDAPDTQPKLEGKSFLSFLNDLENKVAPASMTTPEFNYWPIIRFAINYRRKMGRGYIDGDIAYNKTKLALNTRKCRFKIDFVRQLKQQSSKRELGLIPCDAMFLTRKLQYIQSMPGTLVHPLVDGLRKVTESLNVDSGSYVMGDPRTEGESWLVDAIQVPLPNPLLPRQYLTPRDAYEYWLRRSIVNNVKKVNKEIELSAPHLMVNAREILYRIEKTTQHYYHWIDTLREISPKIVFMSSFSGAHYVCAAARRLGITVVDIQHGGMNPYHPIVRKWDHAPLKGYQLLPDIFWCWSRRSASYIDFPQSTPHRAVVGGNPKAALEFIDSKAVDQPQDIESRPSSTAKLRILVALQYGVEPLLMPHVMQALIKHADRYDWVFRLHPMGWNRADEAIEKLNLERDKLEKDSRVPLHIQLPQMDLVLTNASTIIFEAKEYGVEAAVCSSIGAAIFDSQIAEGEIFLTETEAQLATLLDELETRRTAVSPMPCNGIKMAKQNLELVRDQFAALISEAGIDQGKKATS